MNEYQAFVEPHGDSFRTADGDFDEWSYLDQNPDVAIAVRTGRLASGHDHFKNIGLEEYQKKIRARPRNVRERSYLLRNPDVASATQSGKFSSGYEHWKKYGQIEEKNGLRKPYSSGASSDVSDVRDSLSTWRDGYVVLPRLFTSEQCDAIVELTERLWRDRRRILRPIDVDVFLDLPETRKVRLSEAPDDAYDHPQKINNLYFFEPLVRSVVMDQKLCRVLRHLLGGDPTAFTSLNFRKGSEQGLHLDTFYMPPAIPHRMVAAWIALDDVSPENGPLRYVPGSNRIPPYYFDGHRLRVDHSVREYQSCGDYMHAMIERLALQQSFFHPRKGDVLIWHALLYHGGSPIANPHSTRHSLVAHYFAAADYPGGSVTGATSLIEHAHGCYYENRPPSVAPGLSAESVSYQDDASYGKISDSK